MLGGWTPGLKATHIPSLTGTQVDCENSTLFSVMYQFQSRSRTCSITSFRAAWPMHYGRLLACWRAWLQHLQEVGFGIDSKSTSKKEIDEFFSGKRSTQELLCISPTAADVISFFPELVNLASCHSLRFCKLRSQVILCVSIILWNSRAILKWKS